MADNVCITELIFCSAFFVLSYMSIGLNLSRNSLTNLKDALNSFHLQELLHALPVLPQVMDRLAKKTSKLMVILVSRKALVKMQVMLSH